MKKILHGEQFQEITGGSAMLGMDVPVLGSLTTISRIRRLISSGVISPWVAAISGRILFSTLRALRTRTSDGKFSVCTAVRIWQAQVGPKRLFNKSGIPKTMNTTQDQVIIGGPLA